MVEEAAGQQQQPGADAFDKHPDQPPEQQAAQRVAHRLGGMFKALTLAARQQPGLRLAGTLAPPMVADYADFK